MPIEPGKPVSDADTYRLAIRAGFSPQQAVTATAISLAEDPNRLPETKSPPNKNGTIDLGLWQINSIHWPNFGGPERLSHAFNNANAAFEIWKQRQSLTGDGFTAWTTYTGGQFRQFLGRAQIAQAEFQGSGVDPSSLIQDLSQLSKQGQSKLESQGIDLAATTAPQVTVPVITNPLDGIAQAIGGGFGQLGTSIHDAIATFVLSLLHVILGIFFLVMILLGLYLLLAN